MGFINLDPSEQGEGELMFGIRDPSGLYTHADVAALLEQAAVNGFSLEAGTALQYLTVEELDTMLNGVSKYAN